METVASRSSTWTLPQYFASSSSISSGLYASAVATSTSGRTASMSAHRGSPTCLSVTSPTPRWCVTMRRRSSSGTAGRQIPLRWRTFSSLSTPTMRKSPYERAASRYSEWPSCRMSNVPMVSTTRRPSTRSASTISVMRR